jgi:hypothetical protein
MWKKGSTTSQTSTPTPTSTSTAVIGNYHYIGCYTDDPSRTLTAKSEAGISTMTDALCAEYCSGFKYFGTEFCKFSSYFYIVFYILFFLTPSLL